MSGMPESWRCGRVLLIAALVGGVLPISAGLAADTSRPPTKAGPTSPPSGSTTVPGGGTTAPPSGGSGGTQPPGMFADVAGKAMPLHYCRVGEPCDVAVHFVNVGASVAASQPIPDPTWTINGQPATPMSVSRMGSGPGWATQEVKQWTGRFTVPMASLDVRAIMPRVPTEKQGANNVASRPVIVGQSDMAVKLDRDNVDWNTRYEIKAEIQNKGAVPTRALVMEAVLVVDVTHMSTPPTPDQCLANRNLSGCVVERHTVDSLAPGQKKRWKIGGKQLATTSVRAHARVGCRDPGPCGDPNLGNNTANKTFGP